MRAGLVTAVPRPPVPSAGDPAAVSMAYLREAAHGEDGEYTDDLGADPQADPELASFDSVLAGVASFPGDLELVRQAAIARAELISAERIASHLRVVQSGFAEIFTEFVKTRHPDVPYIDLVAEVAGSTLAAACVVAVENWGRKGCKGDLGEIVATALNLVRSGLAPLS